MSFKKSWFHDTIVHGSLKCDKKKEQNIDITNAKFHAIFTNIPWSMV